MEFLCFNMIVTSSKILGTTTRFLVIINKLKMSKFAAEKEKYLNMPKEMKRKEYVNRSFVELKDVPTWAEYYEANIAKVTVKLEKTVVEYEKGMTTHPKVNKEFNKLVSMWQGDITSLEIDAVVNAANNSLMGGGGVDGAIHRAAGPMLKEETKTLGGCETGQAKITGGYKLPAKYIIHTVGPRGETTELLQSCYNNSLKLLVENNLRTVAFPCISTGIYGYPQIAAAHVALGCVRGFLEKHSAKVDRIIFALFLDEDVNIYEYLMRLYFPVS